MHRGGIFQTVYNIWNRTIIADNSQCKEAQAVKYLRAVLPQKIKASASSQYVLHENSDKFVFCEAHTA